MDIQSEISRGIKLRQDGNLSGAIQVYEQVNRLVPRNSMVLHMLAHSYWEAERYDAGFETYKELIAISPKSESASLGFFHCAWNLGEYDEAMAEVERFQSTKNGSDDYEVFLRWVENWNKMRRSFDFKDLTRFRIKKDEAIVSKKPKEDFEDEE